MLLACYSFGSCRCIPSQHMDVNIGSSRPGLEQSLVYRAPPSPHTLSHSQSGILHLKLYQKDHFTTTKIKYTLWWMYVLLFKLQFESIVATHKLPYQAKHLDSNPQLAIGTKQELHLESTEAVFLVLVGRQAWCPVSRDCLGGLGGIKSEWYFCLSSIEPPPIRKGKVEDDQVCLPHHFTIN